MKKYPLMAVMAVMAVMAAGTGAAAAADNPARIYLPAGKFKLGSDSGLVDERPVQDVRMPAFYLDKSPVSVRQFSQFIDRSGYTTTAAIYGNSGVFNFAAGRWEMIEGADWQYPLGPRQAQAPLDHPVTQVSWHDAVAYCKAAGGRLPNEAEFEYAAKGAGQYGDPVYAFGETIRKDGEFLVNVFNGDFPFRHSNEDGYTYTAPIGKTGLTPLGFTDMAGNVWEWTSDWYGPYQVSAEGDYLPRPAGTEKAQRGGSFLCDEDVCHGYRTTGRTHSTPETSLVHVGFRCAYSLAGPDA